MDVGVTVTVGRSANASRVSIGTEVTVDMTAFTVGVASVGWAGGVSIGICPG